MWANRAASRILLAAALASALARSARAEGPPPLPPPEPPEAQVDQVDQADHVAVEPPVCRPPWTGREAIWGGVGLIIAGTATFIVVTPALCAGMGGGGTQPGATSTASAGTTCVEAVVGGAAGAVGIGVILLAIGETQRATYQHWLHKHPMFGGLSLAPGTRGPALGWGLSF
jgi:hypothetical protein